MPGTPNSVCVSHVVAGTQVLGSLPAASGKHLSRMLDRKQGSQNLNQVIQNAAAQPVLHYTAYPDKDILNALRIFVDTSTRLYLESLLRMFNRILDSRENSGWNMGYSNGKWIHLKSFQKSFVSSFHLTCEQPDRCMGSFESMFQPNR